MTANGDLRGNLSPGGFFCDGLGVGGGGKLGLPAGPAGGYCSRVWLIRLEARIPLGIRKEGP